MPGGDRTGPMGRGPQTGWGLGDCAGGQPMDNRWNFGRGGMRRRRFVEDSGQYPQRGRGRGRGFFGSGWEASSVEAGPQEANELRSEIMELRAELDRLLERLDASPPQPSESDKEE